MRWGLDAAFPPSGDELWRQFTDGYSWFAGYVGGKAANVWTPADWQRVEAVGFSLLPIWVAPLVDDAGHFEGVADGNDCVQALAASELGGIVVLDVENGLTPRQYATGFLEALNAADVGVVLYGTPTTIHAIGDLAWRSWWLAFYPEPGMRRVGGLPDWTYWQIASGAQTDYNVCADDAPFALLGSPEAPSATPTGEA